MSAATDSNTSTIYIVLLDEGTTVLRPTQGIARGEDVYEVLAIPGYDPDDEHWEFTPGNVVKCEQEIRGGEEILVARSLAG